MSRGTQSCGESPAQSEARKIYGQYFVYMMTNPNHTVLYTGVTNDLSRRIEEHRSGDVKAFTTRYNVTKLVYYEVFEDPESANAREKQIKGGSRHKKIQLVESMNPEWKDLSCDL
jgi:putative endonuclease